MNIIIKDNALFSNFVSPQICMDLKNAGLSDNTHFRWKIVRGELFIATHLFDEDKY